MMKKLFPIFLLLCLICLISASCSKGKPSPSAAPESGLINSNDENSDIETQDVTMEDVAVDVDLTALSSTMVYAEVYNIMMDPDSYEGKSIRGIGEYGNYYYEEMDRYFHYLIISDATGCCPQGLDFVLNGEYTYPDDYPAIGENVEVKGVFVKSEIEGQSNYYLAVDDITILNY